jgi:hypothetical protein
MKMSRDHNTITQTVIEFDTDEDHPHHIMHSHHLWIHGNASSVQSSPNSQVVVFAILGKQKVFYGKIETGVMLKNDFIHPYPQHHCI